MHNDSRHSASASKTPPVDSSLVSLKEKSLTPSPPRVDFVSYSHLRGLLSVPSDDDSEPSIETLPSEESESSSSSSSRSSVHLSDLLMSSTRVAKIKRYASASYFVRAVIVDSLVTFNVSLLFQWSTP